MDYEIDKLTTTLCESYDLKVVYDAFLRVICHQIWMEKLNARYLDSNRQGKRAKQNKRFESLILKAIRQLYECAEEYWEGRK